MSTILTVSGRYVDVACPKREDFHIEDIAHALSHACRFAGHVKEFYSVAQHCVLVSRWVGDQDAGLAMAALLHDASEAYLCDLPYPIKHKTILGFHYSALEERLLEVIGAAFGETLHPTHPLIKKADMVLCATEAKALMTHFRAEDWDLLTAAPDPQIVIEPWSSEKAREEFLMRYGFLDDGLSRTTGDCGGTGCGGPNCGPCREM